jgi:hypothetical protein
VERLAAAAIPVVRHFIHPHNLRLGVLCQSGIDGIGVFLWRTWRALATAGTVATATVTMLW